MKPRAKVALIDTNVILRFLLDDEPTQARSAARLMSRLEIGRERAELADVVLAETAWVLEKRGGVPRPEIAAKLTAILMFTGVRHRAKGVVLEALTRYRDSRCDIVDCLLAAGARRRGAAVWSFDADYRKLGCAWRTPR